MGLEYTLNDNEKLKLRIGEERAKELGLKSERDKRERFIYDAQWEIAVQKLLEG